MSHPLVLGLFSTPSMAADGARAPHALGISRDFMSVVARTHADAQALAEGMDATAGVDLEDSRPAARLGELGGRALATVALVMPEDWATCCGGAARGGALTSAGLPHERGETLQREVARGAVLLAVHIAAPDVAGVRDSLSAAGATAIEIVTWP